MIRSEYTNKQLLKMSKYKKLLIVRSYNMLLIFALFVYLMSHAIRNANIHPFTGILIGSLALLIGIMLVVLNNRSFYGLMTPIKVYQSLVFQRLNINLSKFGFNAFLNALLVAAILFFSFSGHLYVTLVVFIATLIVNIGLVDFNDRLKIVKYAEKNEIDTSEYRILDNDLFDNMTIEQRYYVYLIREQIRAHIEIEKLEQKEIKALLDKHDYTFITLVARQIEKLGK